MSLAVALRRPDSILDRLLVRAESVIDAAVTKATGPGSPSRLRQAISYAVLSGGGRLRPTLCLSVAHAYGDPSPEAADAAAVAVELVHCASLVHDDLPCFDDATMRRGKPTVHSAFGVPTAVLVGDALIVLAFAAVARTGAGSSVTALADAIGPERGIIAGQAWESEATIPLEEYHRSKTASLFEVAALLGAQAGGADGSVWRPFGEAVGRAYQAADDLLDAIADSSLTGKTGGRDAALLRPSIVRSHGLAAARRRVTQLVDEVWRAVPPCPRDDAVRVWITGFGDRIASYVPVP